MSKQTAVEWLITQLPMGVKNAIADKIEQAKEMEKQQLEEAYRTSIKDSIDAKQ